MTPRNVEFAGTLEINEQSGSGYLRDQKRNYSIKPNDPAIPRGLIQRLQLRGGESIEGTLTTNQQHPPGRNRRKHGKPNKNSDAFQVRSINDRNPEQYGELKGFEDLTVVSPTDLLRFETKDGPATMRVVDLWTPIGKGQRGLIVAPPRTGKTVLLKELAHGIIANHPEVLLMMLLIDERPEEVTEMRRSLCPEASGWQNDAPEVVFSNNDCDAKSHGRIAKLMIQKAKRCVELGKDVVILLDSLTRLGRAFNNLVGSSGRTMTGGLDIRALEIPKQIFGAARKIENGGSLTIIASALIETGSRMDDFIFQEFKGTGNMELVLSRELADRRLWPAVNLFQSGTRKEELLLGQANYDKMSRLRRRLLSAAPVKQMETLLEEIAKRPTNKEYLDSLSA
ncbi:MAG: transcription termination factor Rho [Planctomycetota bacterium]|nr:transcription termination factor Rho [Planctomycetota bacterium]